MQKLKPIVIVSRVVLWMTLCAGCGVSGRGTANPNPDVQDVVAGTERDTAVTMDVGADEAGADAPPPPAMTTPQDLSLIHI